MKRFIFLLSAALLFFLSGCHDGDRAVNQQLTAIDSLLAHELVDSALHELNRVDTASMSDAVRAYYDLLRVQTYWKAYIPVESDTLLNFSLSYYKEHGPEERLARTYYYIAEIQREDGRVNAAIENLKRAEKIAERIGNLLLQNKIYGSLGYIDLDARETEIAFGYLQKALQISTALDNKGFMFNDLENLAIAYQRLGHRDSCLFYLEKCVPLASHVPSPDRAHMLASLGTNYIMVNKEKAKEVLKESIALKPYEHAYRSLALLYTSEEKWEDAETCFLKALKLSKQAEQKMFTLQCYRDLKTKQGDYRAANELASEINQLKDSIGRQRKAESVGMQQQGIEHQAERQRLDVSRHRIAVVASVALLLLALIAVLFYLWWRQTERRMRAGQKLIDDLTIEIDKLKLEARRQDDQLRRADMRMEQLQQKQNEAVEHMNSKYAEQLSHGKQMYEALMKGGTIVSWQKKDRADFEIYCRMADMAFSAELNTHHKKCTPNQRMYLILRHLGMDDVQVQNRMGMSADAWRMMLSRMKLVS